MFRNVFRFVNFKNPQNLLKLEKYSKSLVCLQHTHKNHRNRENGKTLEFSPIICASVLSIFNIFKKENPDEESELVMLIKRSILCMQREQYDKAEQVGKFLFIFNRILSHWPTFSFHSHTNCIQTLKLFWSQKDATHSSKSCSGTPG